MTDTMHTNGQHDTRTVTRASYVDALDSAMQSQRDDDARVDVLDAVRALLRMHASQRALVEQLVRDGLTLGVDRADDEITRARSVHGLTSTRRVEKRDGKGKRA